MKTIKVSQKYFINHVVDRLKKIDKDIREVDGVLYGKEEHGKEWRKVRDSALEIEDLIEALDPGAVLIWHTA